MKLIHLSDLHLGKRVNDFSMIEDQKYILQQTLDVIDNEKPDAVLIAGDIYDKQVPMVEAVALFDDFLTKLTKNNSLKVYMISGNHDSAQRISFGAEFFHKDGIFISPVFDGAMQKFSLDDEYGTVNIYLLPFIKPVTVQRFYEEELESYTDAVKCVINHTEIDKSQRNVILSHQFVTGAIRSDSEEVSVGGLDHVDSDVYDDFDYVALGHLHAPQSVTRAAVRYSGTLLKYSFSEINQKKSITVVELGAKEDEKTNVNIREIPLKPLHDLRQIKGTYEELTLRENYIKTKLDDYIHVILTDEEDIPDALAKLRSIYPNIMRLEYDNTRTKKHQDITQAQDTSRTPQELFEEFYHLQNNQEMSEEQREYVTALIEKIWEEKP
jgi:exonuclease SbcD